ncbi:MAG: serine/threonine-protein phosphatase [Deltaproteobacteria bacterium]|nr:serine/threonine-protein phosphatase [Deltaproteobacteria bacterium]
MKFAFRCMMDNGPRANQEDALLVGETVYQGHAVDESGQGEAQTVVAVALDGLGGHSAGERVSAQTAELLSQKLAAAGTDQEAVNQALVEVQKEMEARREDLDDGGTTATGLLTAAGRVLVFNLGDSRVYRVSPGPFSRVSTDHSVVQRMIGQGLITEKEAFTSPFRNLVEFGLGPTFDHAWEKYQVNFTEEAIEGEAVYLLCTDGVCDLFSDEKLAEVMADGSMDRAQALMDELKTAGLKDNTSFILLRVSA